MALAFLGCSNV